MVQIFVKNCKDATVIFIKIEHATNVVWDMGHAIIGFIFTFQRQWMSILYGTCEMYIMQFSNAARFGKMWND